LPVTESIADRTIALPFFNALTELEMDEVCSRLREVLAQAAV
jgi:dTDP-4-amino-4,6-dideoxygalactose transaminase